MPRRRRLPEPLAALLAAFLGAVDLVERAKRALTDAVPTTRLPGRPLPDALSEFEELLTAAGSRMGAWRSVELADAWEAARAGIAEALRRSEALRLRGTLEDFEDLIGAIGDLIEPLEALEGVAERFRALRS